MFLSLMRIIKFSLQDIHRNIWLSLITVLIMILGLFSVDMLLSVRAISNAAVATVKDKIDISLYLKNDLSEQQIMDLKGQLEKLSDVKAVQYISRDQALAIFKQRRQGNADIMDALKQLDGNPLNPTLLVKAKSLDNYENLVNNINATGGQLIESESGDFAAYKTLLSRINDITNRASQAGLALSLVFVIIAILIIYNTIRVSIYTHREEIVIMRLVGASNWFIKAPFLVSSLFYTLLSLTTVTTLFFLFLNLLQPYLETFFMGYEFNILRYFQTNFLPIFGLELLAALIVNLLASTLAVNKYSKV